MLPWHFLVLASSCMFDGEELDYHLGRQGGGKGSDTFSSAVGSCFDYYDNYIRHMGLLMYRIPASFPSAHIGMSKPMRSLPHSLPVSCNKGDVVYEHSSD